MATPTYTLIDSTTLGTASTLVDITGLDTSAAGYRDLVLVVDGSTASNQTIFVRLNADYLNTTTFEMRGDGSTATASSASGINAGRMFGFATTQSNAIVHIFDFAQTDKHKTYIGRCNSATYTSASVHRYGSTTAVTSVRILSGVNFNAGTSFTIYGIEA